MPASDPPAEPNGPGGPDRDTAPVFSAGRVGKPHTLDGTMHVTRPRTALLTAGTIVTIDGVEREVVHRGGTDTRPLLKLSGVDHISEVERLRGQDLFLPRTSLPPLADDEFWPDELVGLPVTSTRGAAVGTVAKVLVLPSCDVLEVRRPAGGDLLVPLHQQAVPEMDVAARRVVVDLAFMDEDEPVAVAGEETDGLTPSDGTAAGPTPDAPGE